MQRIGVAWPKLATDSLLHRARVRTGLRDLEGEQCSLALEKLVDSLNGEAALSPVGRIAAHYNLIDLLSVRLRLVEQRRQEPAIAAARVAPPLVIVGLPRTGTTILFELIAQDSSVRAPASWEVARPVPAPPATSAAASTRHDPRIAQTERTLRWMERLAPGFRTIHALGARHPQECVYMLASQFMSDQFSYMYDIPDYRDWLLTQDMTEAYAWHAAFLQHLQTSRYCPHWVLKTPAHLAHLGALVAQYPDAMIVWTHRKPIDALASFSSLTATLRGAFSDAVEPLQVGPGELNHFAQVAAKADRARRGLPAGNFFDASFEQICHEPLAVVRQIYANFNLTLSAEAEERMYAYLLSRPRHLYGEHQYSAADFGLEEQEVTRAFAGYAATYANWL